DANHTLALFDRRKREPAAGEGAFGKRLETALTREAHPGGMVRLPLRARGLKAQLAIASKLGRLGTVHMELAYKPHEEGFVPTLLDILRVEVSQHWHRIKLLVDQKLLDYRYLREQTRGEIMSRFLAKVLVAKFSDGKTMEENLKAVLVPRPTRAAL